MTLILLIIFLVFIVLGIPIAFSMGLLTIIGLDQLNVDLMMIPAKDVCRN